MARSRAKYRKNRPKVRVRVPKKPKRPQAQDVAIPGSQEILKLDEKTVTASYKSAGILADPNRLQSHDLPLTDAVMESLETDDVRSALGKKRRDGKNAGLQRLTKMQRVHIARLIKQYGNDFEAMARDIKLNTMQHSQGVLRKLCARFHAYHQL
ncbi:nucleolar protein 16-like [Selaginella moellendorffii]|uniref:nucleolar protein 16-like n=1 Tax=Selaginella moellendorffii TaxID=88036 RepID=UPI000D1CB187|nr:nucleolar protein 16-like [Selaginella moellendorffii]|eukprot:XP_024521917.1 nucleolar protein 16-like [Selaginella moellendorffii]